ncbi:hypothetical protein GALMADRAFT_220568 [Galerina marginata CBS 339.88]|uniref:C3H1-type domain-containing protein n=1 Tax=Galerina marginata (strain CBS 339.88) TaxID=685588 RepID=A0A067TRP7_GALM3|nr:hypothetical protein GALMADRAFT_220568 [Galerina marginata CBS 339.88]
MSRKSQSQKKRHTKPCKFFQVNKCPHPADVCDFAHVIANPGTPSVPESSPAMCRYYYAGSCVNGALCRYRHGNEASEIFNAPISPTSAADWPTSTDGTYLDSPPQYGSYSSFPQSWSSSAYSLSSSFPPLVESALFASPPRSRDSIDTCSTSLSSLESDEVVVATEDPQYLEHPHSHQSQVCVMDDSPVIHVPPFLPLSYMNPVGTLSPSHSYDFVYSLMGGLKLPGQMKSRTGGSKSSSKQKALKYKTKPCKFFPTERGCPNGSACTFVHDEGRSRTSSPPSKLSKLEDNVRKNFIPIPWRVIGGGVLVGVQRDEDADNDSDDSSLDSDDSSSLDPYPQHSTKNVPSIKIITRRRSNSIPPTPSTTQVRVENLFSAESPGVL